MTDPLTLSDVEFHLLRELIHERFGILTKQERRQFVEMKLAARVRQLGLVSFGEYYRFLKYKDHSEREIAKMISLLANNETYFFREEPQLRVFQQRLLPQMKREKLAANDKTIRVVSAGCSTGEEVYTLAILTLESGILLQDWKVRIVGLDVSEAALNTARRGVYYARSFRGVQEGSLSKYFRSTLPGAHEIKDSVRSLTRFVHANLAAPSTLSQIQGADVILCRNVLIYFSEERTRAAVEMFFRGLRSGGYLLLGHAETLVGVFDEFEVLRCPGSVVYVKP